MGFSVLAAREMKQEPKKMKGGGGAGEEGRKRLQTNPSILKNLRSPANAASDFSPPPPRSFTYAIFRAVFDSRSSFFAPKPHGNACYAG